MITLVGLQVLVENGEIQYPVSEITIAGNLKEMWANMVTIADDIETRSNIQCGSVLIPEMSIAGSRFLLCPFKATKRHSIECLNMSEDLPEFLNKTFFAKPSLIQPLSLLTVEPTSRFWLINDFQYANTCLNAVWQFPTDFIVYT